MNKQLFFSETEFKNRHSVIQAEMEEQDVDILLIDQPEFIFHVLGYAMSEGFQQFCVLPQRGAPVMILRCVDEGTCHEHGYVPSDNVIGYNDWSDPVEVLREEIAKRGLNTTRIAIDRDSYNMTLNRFDALKSAFPSSGFVDFSTFVRETRSLKSDAEIAYLKRASKIADDALAAILAEFRCGKSGRDCVAMAAKHTILLGGDAGVIGPVTPALDDSKMHALIDDVPLMEGDLLHVELIPQYLGYSARIMRPVFIGSPPSDTQEKAELIVGLQDDQIAAMKTGARACDVDKILRNGMINAGLKNKYENVSGYSLGYYQQFTCRSSDFTYVFRPGDTWELKRNMVFHMYTVAHGLAFSETVVVTDEGGLCLTETPRKLLNIAI